jgi:hypothetical protein
MNTKGLYMGKPLEDYSREELIDNLISLINTSHELNEKVCELKIDAVGKIPRYSKVSFWEWLAGQFR